MVVLNFFQFINLYFSFKFQAIDASLSLVESMLFGILFHFAFQVKDISEMKRASQASRLHLSAIAATPRGSPAVERRMPTSEIVLQKTPVSFFNGLRAPLYVSHEASETQC